MAQKGIIKNTTKEGYVEASNFADINQAIIGKDGILDYKEKLSISKINDNKVRIKSGLYNLRGHIIQVDDYIDLEVESGTLGMKRYDTVIAEYVKNGVEPGTDKLELSVVKGVASTTSPVRSTLVNTQTKYQSMVFEIYMDGTQLSILDTEIKSLNSLSSSKKTELLKTTVWTNWASTLGDSIENYDLLLVVIQADTYVTGSVIINVSDIVYTQSNSMDNFIATAFQSASVYANVQFRFSNKNTIVTTGHITAGWQRANLKAVYGIRL